jgi:hypothetical protein
MSALVGILQRASPPEGDGPLQADSNRLTQTQLSRLARAHKRDPELRSDQGRSRIGADGWPGRLNQIERGARLRQRDPAFGDGRRRRG